VPHAQLGLSDVDALKGEAGEHHAIRPGGRNGQTRSDPITA
jgi:hypothetical protein